MCVSQIVVVKPRLVPSQLPWGRKEASSRSAIPILSLCANNTGISSTRSVVMVSFSVIQQAYRNFKMLSLFDRTMSKKVQYFACPQPHGSDAVSQPARREYINSLITAGHKFVPGFVTGCTNELSLHFSKPS